MPVAIAREPLAMNAMTFDAKPPGEEPTNTRPAAIAGGKPNACAKAYPTSVRSTRKGLREAPTRRTSHEPSEAA